MSTRALLVASAIGAAAAISACATKQSLVLEQARMEVAGARSDDAIEQYAATKLEEAEAALARAEKVFENSRDEAEVDHLAYVTRQKVKIAEATAEERRAREAFEELGNTRDRAVLEARERELARKQSEIEQAQQAWQRASERARELEDDLAELKAKETKRGLVLTLGDILFEIDGAELTAGGRRQLGRLADFLGENPDRNVLIEGHTDSTGSEQHNRELSLLRAEAVRRFLAGDGIAPGRIAAAGYGESYPVASNRTPTGRQQNRRVEIIVLKRGATASGSLRGDAATSNQEITIHTR